VVVLFSRVQAGYQMWIRPTSGSRVPALDVGLKNNSMDDCSKLPLWRRRFLLKFLLYHHSLPFVHDICKTSSLVSIQVNKE
jgi:hypothetical protein